VNRFVPYLILLGGLVLLFASERYLAGFTFEVRTETVRVSNINQVLPLSEQYVRPILYTHLEGLASMPTGEAKKTFISAVLPAILVAKHEITMLRLRLKRLEKTRRWNHADSALFRSAIARFKAGSLSEVMLKIGTLPNSVVLAQAAVESGWGQSRIFLEGNNLFGIWSFDPNESRIAAGETRGKRTIWLRSYNNMSQSIISYFDILSTSHAFKGLRQARTEETEPLALLPYLKNFSERRGAYTRQLKTVIQQNDLTRYDDFELDPEYLYEK
jgi:Bax protein